jgi:hypothetical protein
MLKMKALRDFPGPYLTRRIKAGDEFEAASERDADLFRKIGHAEDIQEKPKRKYERRDMTAEGAQD